MALNAGTTVYTLKLDRGYYRVSNASHLVLECHRHASCRGGADAENYCEPGYIGPCEYNKCVKLASLHPLKAFSKYWLVLAVALPAGYDKYAQLDEAQTPCLK